MKGWIVEDLDASGDEWDERYLWLESSETPPKFKWTNDRAEAHRWEKKADAIFFIESWWGPHCLDPESTYALHFAVKQVRS